MARRREPDQRGRRTATLLRRRLGAELRQARVARGISQRTCALEAGMSKSQLGRIERAEIASRSIEQACRAAAALGLALSLSAYPDGSPVRDAGQLRLEARYRVVVHGDLGWQTEVPMPIPGDRRAWDVVLTEGTRRAGCECEQRLGDIQALERRLALKLRDGAVDVLILVVADTAWNRRVVREHREALRELLPLDSREVLLALRAGRLPAANGLVFI
jgi:transcriptional regulator with XRE-family HTH domain